MTYNAFGGTLNVTQSIKATNKRLLAVSPQGAVLLTKLYFTTLCVNWNYSLVFNYIIT